MFLHRNPQQLPRCHHEAASGLRASPPRGQGAILSPLLGAARPRAEHRAPGTAGRNPQPQPGRGLDSLQNGWNRTQDPKPRAALPGSPGQTLETMRSSENCLFFFSPKSRWFWLNSPPRNARPRAPAALPWKRVFSEGKIPRVEEWKTEPGTRLAPVPERSGFEWGTATRAPFPHKADKPRRSVTGVVRSWDLGFGMKGERRGPGLAATEQQSSHALFGAKASEFPRSPCAYRCHREPHGHK